MRHPRDLIHAAAIVVLEGLDVGDYKSEAVIATVAKVTGMTTSQVIDKIQELADVNV